MPTPLQNSRVRLPRWTVVLAICLPLPVAAAQEVSGPPGPRLLLDRAEEIRLARSAAPAAVSGTARVWYFERGRYVVADSGSSDVECYVSRSWPLALEPHCFDAEGARTIMRMHRRGVELANAGISKDSAARELAAGIASGQYPLPARPAMSWMMSSAQVLYSDTGQRAGAWLPHIMIYIPYLTAQMAGTGTNQDPYAGMVVNAGKPTANLTLVVPRAVKPTAVAAPAPGRGHHH
jgi:hypothetical protein